MVYEQLRQSENRVDCSITRGVRAIFGCCGFVRQEHDNHDTHKYRAIRDVEGWPMVRAEIKIEEIDDRPVRTTIDDVSYRAS
jgi:hypothetical protein